MIQFVRQSLLLLLPFIFVFVWQETLLSKFTLQTIGVLVLAYLILSSRKRKQKDAVFFGGSVDVFIFTTIVLLVVLATGNYSSGIFFLLYFLCFGIAFVFRPTTVFIFVIYSVVLLTLLGYTFTDDVMSNYIKIGSLVLLSPLAYFFGRELGQEQKKDEGNERIANNIEQNVSGVLKKEKHLQPDTVAKLTKIVEDTEILRENSR